MIISLLLFTAKIASAADNENKLKPGKGQNSNEYSQNIGRKHFGIFDFFWDNAVDSHYGWNLFYHGSAVGSTIVMVKSGADRKVMDYFQEENPLGREFAQSGLVLGMFWHLVPGAYFYFYGRYSDDYELCGAGAAGVQAVGLVFFVHAIEKFFSGRKAPNLADKDNKLTMSHERSEDPGDFKFPGTEGYKLSDKRFYWPSGHTATTVGFVSSMTAYYPDKIWIPCVGYPLSLLMGLAMIEGDYHWASDVVAGTLIGHVIGWTVGKRFRKEYNRRFMKSGSRSGEDNSEMAYLDVYPVVYGDGVGIAVEAGF